MSNAQLADDNILNMAQLRRVLTTMIKASAKSDCRWTYINESVLLEVLAISKQVICERLIPYRLSPDYKERRSEKGNGEQRVIESILEQTRDALYTSFSDLKPVMNRIIDLLITPIFEEISRIGLSNTAQEIYEDLSSTDLFVELAFHIENINIAPSIDDAKIAAIMLDKWCKQIRDNRKKVKPIDRLTLIRTISDKVQATKSHGDPIHLEF